MSSIDPFIDLRRALLGDMDTLETAGVRIDSTRQKRTGAPEVIYAKGKTAPQIEAAVRRLILVNGRALAARVTPEQVSQLGPPLQHSGFTFTYDANSGTLCSWQGEQLPSRTGGRVGIITAGSSDRAQASEAAAILFEMGCDVHAVHDVGVAGLHRLVAPLRDVLVNDPDALIVAAGMDGVLPSVVSGLVSIPIIGLPTSTGYGFGGEGLGALTTMLQTCSPGVAVVNIDNGIGAGIMAGLIANRAASQRCSSS